ncbi:alpha/beta hydrolase [Jiella marina]|uniref:alpha/beta hydrolase n=1 Tax=Jiella sp. LLJ827 TaxID=2917712 RepID=UPI002101BCD6|nr:alpha/beta hydrolase-fold protein [Jiella sp. LLJ827]MCQ0986037.1 hypothetical protein [Jiella sp. LLJ827]
MWEEHGLSFAGRPYRVFLQTIGQEPPAGWPVKLVLDGDQVFKRASEIARGEGVSQLLVGIGLPEPDASARIARRYFEMTDRAPASAIPLRPGTPSPETGGERLFAGFMRSRLLPWLHEEMRLDRSDIALFGHSLAGLFTLRSFLRADLPVTRFFAVDPSVWWNRHRIMAELDESIGHRRLVPSDDVRQVTILTAGRRLRGDLSLRESERLADLRGGPNGESFALSLFQAGHRFVRTEEWPDESHGSIIAPALRRFLHVP